MFAGLAIALGGGHLAIAALAALPSITRLAHLAVPELVRRHGSWAVAASASWLERAGFLGAAVFGVFRPEGGGSEERRGGEEGRSWWSAYHSKKNNTSV